MFLTRLQPTRNTAFQGNEKTKPLSRELLPSDLYCKGKIERVCLSTPRLVNLQVLAKFASYREDNRVPRWNHPVE